MAKIKKRRERALPKAADKITEVAVAGSDSGISGSSDAGVSSVQEGDAGEPGHRYV